MKFREEVLTKIFTYITVITLLGIVAFEAYLLQTERVERRKAQAAGETLQENLDRARKINFDLESHNEELQAFYRQWSVYAAFRSSRDIKAYQWDLFSRPALIPKEAIEAWQFYLAQKQEPVEEAGGDDIDDRQNDKKEKEAQPEETPVEPVPFFFGNPDGEDIFLPFAIGANNGCLIYTVAYNEAGESISLLYELFFDEGQDTPKRDENGEIIWNCVSYDVGEGWKGISKKETEE